MSEYIVSRKEDMSPLGYLRLMMQPDGDVIVMVFEDPTNDGALERGRMASVEFCAYSGGGKSKRTLKALKDLAVAMAEDNADAEQGECHRGEFLGELFLPLPPSQTGEQL